MMFRWKPHGNSFPSLGYGWIIAALVIPLWCAALAVIAVERDAARAAIVRETGHLAQLIEERAEGAVQRIDQTLKALRSGYARTGGAPGWSQLVSEASINLSPASIIFIIDENGTHLAASTSSADRTISLSGADYWRIHANEPADILLISGPLQEPPAYAGNVVLTRKLEKPDGNWAGVVAISLDPALIARLHETTQNSQKTEMMLIGRDGIVRWADGNAAGKPGTDLSRSDLFRTLERENHGSFWQKSDGAGGGRVVSYRALADTPLVVAVSAADEKAAPDFTRYRYMTFAVAGFLSLLLIGAAVAASRIASSLEKIRDALSVSQAQARSKSAELELTLNHMSQGIMIVDRDGQLDVINHAAVALLDLPPSCLKHPPNFMELVDYLRRRGGRRQGGLGSALERGRAFKIAAGAEGHAGMDDAGGDCA